MPVADQAPTGGRPRALRFLDEQVVRVLGESPFELGAAMTLVMIAVSLHEPFWYLKAGIMVLAATALVVRRLVWNPLLWLGLVGVFVLSFTFTWFDQNNHDYLKLYWCLGIGVALLAADPQRALRWNARVLLGLCFLFATLWKVLSPDYLSGAFFNYFLVQDSRFELIAHHIGGLGAYELFSGRLARVGFQRFGDLEAGLAVADAVRVSWVAPILTWWTVFIEGLVAAAFLWPEGRGLSRWRDLVLLVFMLSTYVIAPILYFAWVLCAMGVVQCDVGRWRYWPLLYVGTFVVLIVRFYAAL